MIDSPPAFSTPTIDYASEAHTHCVQYLMLKWFNLPNAVPAHEVAELRDDIQRVIRFFLNNLESSTPELQARLVCDMRGLADLLTVLTGDIDIPNHCGEPLDLSLPFTGAELTPRNALSRTFERGRST